MASTALDVKHNHWHLFGRFCASLSKSYLPPYSSSAFTCINVARFHPSQSVSPGAGGNLWNFFQVCYFCFPCQKFSCNPGTNLKRTASLLASTKTTMKLCVTPFSRIHNFSGTDCEWHLLFMDSVAVIHEYYSCNRMFEACNANSLHFRWTPTIR